MHADFMKVLANDGRRALGVEVVGLDKHGAVGRELGIFGESDGGGGRHLNRMRTWIY